jgi:hypothetical protein
VLAVVGAVGLDRLPGGRRGLWIVGLALTQLALTAVAWAGLVTSLRGRRPGDPADLAGAVAGLLEAAGAPSRGRPAPARAPPGHRGSAGVDPCSIVMASATRTPSTG